MGVCTWTWQHLESWNGMPGGEVLWNNQGGAQRAAEFSQLARVSPQGCGLGGDGSQGQSVGKEADGQKPAGDGPPKKRHGVSRV